MTKHLATVVVASLVFFALPAVGRTQGWAHSSTTIGTSGDVVLERTAQRMRMMVQMTAQGKTLEEAVAKLKERREKATAQLEKFGADKKSIKAAQLRIGTGDDSARRRMEMMVQQRLGKKGKGRSGAKPPVTVSLVLTAEWPLQGDTPEKRLVASDAVQQKVKAIDFAGAKEASTLSAEEQEMAEEAAAEVVESMGGGDGENEKPGQPVFLYVATIDPADVTKARAEAYAKAKVQGEELAKTAGVELGPMTGLQASVESESSMNEGGDWNMRFRQMQAYMLRSNQLSADNRESISSTPEDIKFVIHVFAEFAIKK